MEKSTFFLNPNATPFIPNFKRSIAADDERTQEVPVDEAFNSLSTEEFPGRGHHQIPKSEDTNPQFADPEIDLDGLEFGLEFLSSLFPNFSMESIADVFHACGDVFEAESMLKKLEQQRQPLGRFGFPRNGELQPSI
ncbi:unnamed protein product [Spirodela intermedia]|uniref:Uncharacterized protein n=1 Tax=Spirodela intermedia TaxID=51605 RepID=A0A7I8KZE8_SPIIN|nr:unnamed protein product [Spirodela intermedia]